MRWPYAGADGKRAVQREAVELKVWRAGEKDPLKKGLEQLDGYLERRGLAEGTLVVFDRRGKGRQKVKIEGKVTAGGGKWGC